MRSIRFTVPGIPVGRSDASEALEYRERIRRAFVGYKKAHGLLTSGILPLSVPVQVDVLAYFEAPKYATKRKRGLMLCGDILYTGKPDTDDIVRNALGALEKCAYEDRRLVTSAYGTKLYAEEAHTEILIIVGQGI